MRRLMWAPPLIWDGGDLRWPAAELMKVDSPLLPLRVAHVINEPFRPEGASGVQQVVYCLAWAQAAGGHAVAVFSRTNGSHFLGNGEAPLASRTTGPVIAATSPRSWIIGRYLERGLVEDVVRWRPDVVHFHSIHIPQNVALAGYLDRVGLPYCVTVHGGLFPQALRRGRLKKALFTIAFERRYLNGARFIHAVSPGEIEAIRRHGVRRPVVVVPNGVPPEDGVAGSRPGTLAAEHPVLRGRRVFLFLGRLDPWQKGLDLLIDAFARARLPDAALVLAGPDRDGSRRALASRAQRAGISSQLVLKDAVFGEDRASLLAAADVFVHPSRWEGLSLSVLTAAAAGKPCLITREADPLGELERMRAAVIVEPSVASIAAGLQRIAALDGDQLREMGERARRVAEAQFAWPSIAARLVDAYRRSIGSRGAW